MSLTLNERFSRIPAPSARVQQTVHVNLSNVRPQQQPRQPRQQQQLSSGRTVGVKKQQSQPAGRLNVKQKGGVSAVAARSGRREAVQERVASGRERAVASRRAAAPKPVQIAQAPLVPLKPFQLAPQFVQQPAFSIGTNTRQGQQQATTQKKGTKKAAPKAPAAGSRQANAARQAGRGKANGANRQAQAKANGAASKKKPGKKQQAPAPASKENLDADMDTYMAAAPASA